MNFDIELRDYPVLRALELAETGKVDGAALRLDPEFLGSGIQNLVAVPTPLVMTRTLLIIRNKATDVVSWEETKRLKVSVWRGTLLGRKLIPKEAAFEVSNEMQGLQMVKSGRLDAALIMEVAYYGTAMSNPNAIHALRVASVKFEAPMYMLINKTFETYSCLECRHPEGFRIEKAPTSTALFTAIGYQS
ncbi:MAG: transporter substrate-binding domain-containing protein [Pseudobdellovibrionaceae bacterium]|nr:transporter substrate-binding domain-containing protein [Pseudobdellovibrionaceae bacterium]